MANVAERYHGDSDHKPRAKGLVLALSLLGIGGAGGAGVNAYLNNSEAAGRLFGGDRAASSHAGATEQSPTTNTRVELNVPQDRERSSNTGITSELHQKLAAGTLTAREANRLSILENQQLQERSGGNGPVIAYLQLRTPDGNLGPYQRYEINPETNTVYADQSPACMTARQELRDGVPAMNVFGAGSCRIPL